MITNQIGNIWVISHPVFSSLFLLSDPEMCMNRALASALELQVRRSILYSVQWLCVCASAISTEKCVSVTHHCISTTTVGVLTSPWCQCCHRDSGAGRGLDKNDERERGRWRREIDTQSWERKKPWLVFDYLIRHFLSAHL